MKENYNSYSFESIKKLWKMAKDFSERRLTTEEEINELCEKGYTDMDAICIVTSFVTLNQFDTIEEKEYYRIGEPRIDEYGPCYLHSFNFADDKRESGVSVATTGWLNSMKSVFFGAHDNDKLRARGVYKIKGVIIGFGGDDEPLIYPTDWAEKTRIRTLAGLRKVLEK